MPEQTSKKAPKERSPSYPIISLKSALDRLERFESTFGRHPAPYQKAGMAWGIKEGSSQANSILAALKSFGFLDYQGSGKDRMVAVSKEGRTYLRAQQEDIKKDVIRRAALKPKAIAKFWPDWKADRPPDAVCLDELVLKHGFNENAAPTFLRVYDETIAFAGLTDSDSVIKSADDDGDEVAPLSDTKVGDLVQIEINGSFVLEKPERVRAIQEHDGTDWVFVEGTETGFPMNQVVVQSESRAGSVGSASPILPENDLDRTPKGHRKAVFPVSEGDVTITFPSSFSSEGLEELSEYLGIFLKKQKKIANRKRLDGE